MSCSNENETLFERVKDIDIVGGVYDFHYFENDSLDPDTIGIGIGDELFFWTYKWNRQGKTSRRYDICEYTLGNDTTVLRTYIKYWESADSILSIENKVMPIHAVRKFSVGGDEHRVFSTVLHTVPGTKKPDQIEFYNDKFGLILTLSQNQESSLSRIRCEDPDELLVELIQLVKEDPFYSLQYEGD